MYSGSQKCVVDKRKAFTLSYRLAETAGSPCVHQENYVFTPYKLNSVFPFNLQQSSQFPAYVLSAASVVPGAGVVMGTSSGRVYLVKSSTQEPQSLSTMDSIPGQVNQLV